MAIQRAIQNEQARLHESDVPLLLDSDENCRQRDVVAVMDAAAGAGIKQMTVLPPRK